MGYSRVECEGTNTGYCHGCNAQDKVYDKYLNNTCFPCEECPDGEERRNCGGINPGVCEPCLPGWFKNDTECMPCYLTESQCTEKGQVLVNCGGGNPGTCELCYNNFWHEGENCVECTPCSNGTHRGGCGMVHMCHDLPPHNLPRHRRLRYIDFP